MMEISGLNMKEAELFLSGLVAEIRVGSEVHIDLSEETKEVVSCMPYTVHDIPTGKVTLTVSWKRNRAKKKSAINKKRFGEIVVDIQSEWGYGGLAGTTYEEFAFECASRYLAEVA